MFLQILVLLTSFAFAGNPKPIPDGLNCAQLVSIFNRTYVPLHETKERAYWAVRQDLKEYKGPSLAEAEKELTYFTSDPNHVILIEGAKRGGGGDPEVMRALRGWEKFFTAHVIFDESSRELKAKAEENETEFLKRYKAAPVGFVDPVTAKFIKEDAIFMRIRMGASDSEADRKAVFEGMRAAEKIALDNGLLGLISDRNRFARSVGFKNFFDYKLQTQEGYDQDTLFKKLDAFREKAKPLIEAEKERLVKVYGQDVLRPWNYDHLTKGDLTKRLDPYFPMDQALGRALETFVDLGIGFNNAKVNLDLIAREGKHVNGFMHGPLPTYMFEDGIQWAELGVSSSAKPGQVGSGYHFMGTLLHELGHAAHFANPKMGTPAHSQEFAPTSPATAESQSMFMEELLNHPAWLATYARDSAGNPMPESLIREKVQSYHRGLLAELLNILIVPYLEKTLYEMKDEDLTAENVLAKTRALEAEFFFCPEGIPRPALTIQHFRFWDSSALYHGYFLAKLNVLQTQAYMKRKYGGEFLGNKNIGLDLEEHYWRTGNEKDFFKLTKDMTGSEFSADDALAMLKKRPAEIDAEITAELERESKRVREKAYLPLLDMHLDTLHGDELISTSDDVDLETAVEKYAAWVRMLMPAPK